MCFFLNKTVYFSHFLCGGERKREEQEERFYEVARKSVKNRQLHRQKQDAESIHLLRGKRGKNAGSQRKDCYH